MEANNYYFLLLDTLKSDIANARLKVAFTVNEELLALYWQIGDKISKQKTQEGWGTNIINRLSADLAKSFPDMKGISPRNLKYMQSFAEAYPSFLQAPLAKSGPSSILQVPLAKLPWYHHITLLDKVKDAEERVFYIEQAVQNGKHYEELLKKMEDPKYRDNWLCGPSSRRKSNKTPGDVQFFVSEM